MVFLLSKTCYVPASHYSQQQGLFEILIYVHQHQSERHRTSDLCLPSSSNVLEVCLTSFNRPRLKFLLSFLISSFNTLNIYLKNHFINIYIFCFSKAISKVCYPGLLSLCQNTWYKQLQRSIFILYFVSWVRDLSSWPIDSVSFLPLTKQNYPRGRVWQVKVVHLHNIEDRDNWARDKICSSKTCSDMFL